MRIEYFTAKWCQPCKWFGPIMGDLAMNSSFPVEIIDVNQNPERMPPDLLGVPTVILYKDNIEKARFTGPKSKTDLAEWITVNA